MGNRKQHKEKFVIIGYGLNFLGFLGYYFVQKPLDLFLVQIVFGIGGTILLPAWDGLYSIFTPKKESVLDWRIYESMFSLLQLCKKQKVYWFNVKIFSNNF